MYWLIFNSDLRNNFNFWFFLCLKHAPDSVRRIKINKNHQIRHSSWYYQSTDEIRFSPFNIFVNSLSQWTADCVLRELDIGKYLHYTFWNWNFLRLTQRLTYSRCCCVSISLNFIRNLDAYTTSGNLNIHSTYDEVTYMNIWIVIIVKGQNFILYSHSHHNGIESQLVLLGRNIFVDKLFTMLSVTFVFDSSIKASEISMRVETTTTSLLLCWNLE